MASVADLVLRIIANDQTASGIGGAKKNLKDLDSTFSRMNSAASLGLGKLSGMLGGEVGHLVGTFASGLDELGEHGLSMGKKMMVAGGMVAGLGTGLMLLGSADKQAQDQLKAAIDNTGNSFSDFSEEVEKAIHTQENYGHSAVDTQTALQKITTATQDPQKAFEYLGVAANLAAARHISLADAADQLDRILAGKGARTLAAFGITASKTGDSVADAQRNVDELSRRLDGQASASVDNFSAKFGILRTKVTDAAAVFGNQFGGALTAAGGAATLLGTVLEFRLIASQRQAAIAATETAVALEGEAVAADTAAAASGRASLGIKGIGKAALGATVAVAAMAALGEAVKFVEEKMGHGAKSANDFADGMRHATLTQGDMQKLAISTNFAAKAAMAFGQVLQGNWAEAYATLRIGQENVDNFGEALAKLVREGHPEIAAAYVAQLGLSAEEAAQKFPAYGQALEESKKSTEDLTASVDAATLSISTQSTHLDDIVHKMHDWYAGGNQVAETEKRLAAETAAHAAATAHAAHVEAAARAARVAAAQAELTALNEAIATYNTEKTALTSLTDARKAEIKQISEQLTASGHLNNVFDTNAYAAATERATTARKALAESEKAVAAARADVGNAKTPQELNAAINAEVQANKALADSKAEVAAADKAKAQAALTPGNLLNSIKSKLSNIKSFYNDLQTLRKRKLPISLIRELIDAGPLQGDQLAKSLLAATPADFNAIINAETQLDQFGAQIGGIVGDADYGSLISRQSGVVATARANAVAAENRVIQVKMYLDGKEVAVALKAYRTSIGGAGLGLG